MTRWLLDALLILVSAISATNRRIRRD